MSKAILQSNPAEQSFSLIKQTAVVICASAVIAVCARLTVPLPFASRAADAGKFRSAVDRLVPGQPP